MDVSHQSPSYPASSSCTKSTSDSELYCLLINQLSRISKREALPEEKTLDIYEIPRMMTIMTLYAALLPSKLLHDITTATSKTTKLPLTNNFVTNCNTIAIGVRSMTRSQRSLLVLRISSPCKNTPVVVWLAPGRRLTRSRWSRTACSLQCNIEHIGVVHFLLVLGTLFFHSWCARNKLRRLS